MLALLAMFGALGAGLVVDAMMSTPSGGTNEESDDTENPDEGGQSTDGEGDGGGSMLDFVEPVLADDEDDDTELTFGYASGSVLDGMPVSDDIEDPADAQQVLVGHAGDDILSGDDAADKIDGGNGDDQLIGRGGDDLLLGGAGRDHLEGDGGDDILRGQGGDDGMFGGSGDDRLIGGMGRDSLAGQEGDDLLSGGSGADTLQGGEGHDTLNGDMGRDWLSGGSDNDLLQGGKSQDTVDGGSGDDTLWGGTQTESDASVDFLNGGAGNDTLMLDAGDVGMGGTGDDTFVLQDLTPGSNVAEISDYDPAEDEIVVMYDAAVHVAPSLSAMPIADSEDVTLMLDGVAVAIVKGGAGMDVSQITLRAA